MTTVEPHDESKFIVINVSTLCLNTTGPLRVDIVVMETTQLVLSQCKNF